MLEGGRAAVQTDADVVATSRVRDLERLLGRTTMEKEILALDVDRPKNL